MYDKLFPIWILINIFYVYLKENRLIQYLLIILNVIFISCAPMLILY